MIKEKNQGPAMITVTLSNGLSARIPVKNWRETLKQMEENIAKNLKKEDKQN